MMQAPNMENRALANKHKQFSAPSASPHLCGKPERPSVRTKVLKSFSSLWKTPQPSQNELKLKTTFFNPPHPAFSAST